MSFSVMQTSANKRIKTLARSVRLEQENTENALHVRYNFLFKCELTDGFKVS
jgi:very-short-patch-repair endonuclease